MGDKQMYNRIRSFTPRSLFPLVLFGALSAVVTPAKAFSTWSVNDDFESNPTDWSPWISPRGWFFHQTGGVPGSVYDFRAGFFAGGSTSDFGLIDKVFTIPAGAPAGSSTLCSLNVFIKPTNGLTGAVQMIDVSTWAYISSTPFSFAPSTTWRSVGTGLNMGGCPRSFNARIVVSSTTSAQSGEIDGVSAQWIFP